MCSGSLWNWSGQEEQLVCENTKGWSLWLLPLPHFHVTAVTPMTPQEFNGILLWNSVEMNSTSYKYMFRLLVNSILVKFCLFYPIQWAPLISLTARLMSGLMSDLVICNFRKSMVMHDTECPYWDQVSLSNSYTKPTKPNQTKPINWFLLTLDSGLQLTEYMDTAMKAVVSSCQLLQQGDCCVAQDKCVQVNSKCKLLLNQSILVLLKRACAHCQARLLEEWWISWQLL